MKYCYIRKHCASKHVCLTTHLLIELHVSVIFISYNTFHKNFRGETSDKHNWQYKEHRELKSLIEKLTCVAFIMCWISCIEWRTLNYNSRPQNTTFEKHLTSIIDRRIRFHILIVFHIHNSISVSMVNL